MRDVERDIEDIPQDFVVPIRQGLNIPGWNINTSNSDS